MSSSITYRPYRETDIPQILSLWQHNSNFGAITEEDFRTWYIDTPYEKAEIILAEDDHKNITGQMVFMPARLLVNGKIINVMKISAPILDTKARFSEAADHPVVNMFIKGYETAKQNGFSLFYFFPARGWLRGLQMFSDFIVKWHTKTYHSFAIPLQPNQEFNSTNFDDLSFEIVNYFNDDYDRLWEKAISGLRLTCALVRKKEWLQYRLGGHCVIEARDSIQGELKGYFAVKKNTGLLVDLFAASTNDLEKIFRGSLQTLVNLYPGTALIQSGKINGMYTDQMAGILKNINIELPDFTFDFGCCALDESIDGHHISADQWYMMPDV